MKNILLQAKQDVVVPDVLVNTEATSMSISIWFWVALVQFLVILFLLIKLKKKQRNLKFGDISKNSLNNAKKGEVDMANLMNSISGSKDLYKKLSRVCHPDRFINTDKQNIAEDIFQEISKYKRDFNKLTELKQRAIKELNINLK
ncbi:J domain-containing protein [Olleya namhaensis]|uniref:J domain-containing protein n=1 Tax=Olleya namhaensis TaxID=1144750 RepID=A0A1I3QGG3_9FLAO|nr:J domain-containing protein [Olleya namhaensis]SFJ32649.1 hypothetical protein SAMN05443431_106117 [Olleya namhaensis]